MYFKYVFEILVFQMIRDTGRHRQIQMVYNSDRHRASGGEFLTPHMVRGCPASLSQRANDRPTRYRFFLFF